MKGGVGVKTAYSTKWKRRHYVIRNHFLCQPKHFKKMADIRSRVHAKGATHNMYRKHPEHLTKHYTKWTKHQSKKDAIQDTNDAQPIISAVEHISVSLSVRYTTVERETVWEDCDVALGDVAARQRKTQ
jgi:hypothetical protein